MSTRKRAVSTATPILIDPSSAPRTILTSSTPRLLDSATYTMPFSDAATATTSGHSLGGSSSLSDSPSDNSGRVQLLTIIAGCAGGLAVVTALFTTLLYYRQRHKMEKLRKGNMPCNLSEQDMKRKRRTGIYHGRDPWKNSKSCRSSLTVVDVTSSPVPMYRNTMQEIDSKPTYDPLPTSPIELPSPSPWKPPSRPEYRAYQSARPLKVDVAYHKRNYSGSAPPQFSSPMSPDETPISPQSVYSPKSPTEILENPHKDPATKPWRSRTSQESKRGITVWSAADFYAHRARGNPYPYGYRVLAWPS